MMASDRLKNLVDSTARFEHRKPKRKRRGERILVLAVIGFVVYTFATQEIRLYNVRQQERQVEDQIKAQEVKREILEEQLKALQDEKYIEKVAREQLGLIKEGEIQYLPQDRP